MKVSNILFIFLATILAKASAQDVVTGEKIYKQKCSVCHSIGKGKIVGPDLKGISARRNEKWLLSFIKSPEAMVAKKDPIAVQLLNEHNQILMPDPELTDAEIKNVLAYIKSQSEPVKTVTTTTTSAAKTTKPAPVKKEEVWIDEPYKIKSYPAAEEINARDFNADVWKKIEAVKIPVSPQTAAYPTLKNPSIEFLTVKSIYRPKEVAFLVQWNDSTKNTEVDADRFCDQFAVQFPVSEKNIPSYMMGNRDGRVHIVHWKAIWQEDCEKGFQDVQIKYPNMWVDVYPGLESYLDRSKRIYAQDIPSELIVETHVTGNLPGTYSNNPMSLIKRKEPLEEGNAEGFGTFTTQETQQARGWAEWNDGKWTLCVVVPVNTGNIYKATFDKRTKVAFALWDGNFENIGGRKHFVPWVDLYLEK